MTSNHKIIRVSDIWGRGNPIPVGRNKFYTDIVWHPGGEPCLPGTDIPRLRLIKIGPRASGGFEDEVYAIVEALRSLRDATQPPSNNRRRLGAGHAR